MQGAWAKQVQMHNALNALAARHEQLLKTEDRRDAMAWGYVRVSKEEQKQSHLSLDAQEKTCRAFHADTLPYLPWAGLVADEAVSASKFCFAQRPGAKRLIESLREGDHIIIPVFDRGFRSLPDFASTWPLLHHIGVEIHILDSPYDFTTPDGQFALNIRAVFAQFESGLLGKRMKTVLREIRSRGCVYKMPSWGYKIQGRRKGHKRYVPDWYVRAVGAGLYWMYHTNGLSYEVIGRVALRARHDQRLKQYKRFYEKAWRFQKVRSYANSWQMICHLESLPLDAVFPEREYFQNVLKEYIILEQRKRASAWE